MKETMTIIEFCDAFLDEPCLSEPQKHLLRMMKQNEQLRQLVKPHQLGYTHFMNVISESQPYGD